MNYVGLIVGAVTFVMIGAFHPIVIKCEYYFGAKVWPVFLVLGIITAVLSLWLEGQLASILCGVLSCSLLWGIKELKEQEKRVERGWFPRNDRKLL